MNYKSPPAWQCAEAGAGWVLALSGLRCAVNAYYRAGDVACKVACKEQEHVCNLLRFAHAAERYGRGYINFYMRIIFFSEWGSHIRIVILIGKSEDEIAMHRIAC